MRRRLTIVAVRTWWTISGLLTLIVVPTVHISGQPEVIARPVWMFTIGPMDIYKPESSMRTSRRPCRLAEFPQGFERQSSSGDLRLSVDVDSLVYNGFHQQPRLYQCRGGGAIRSPPGR